MLYWEILATFSQIPEKKLNALCGQNVEFASVKAGGIYSHHWASKG
jgi:hypothetical protein